MHLEAHEVKTLSLAFTNKTLQSYNIKNVIIGPSAFSGHKHHMMGSIQMTVEFWGIISRTMFSTV